jgi:hypothetical protein
MRVGLDYKNCYYADEPINREAPMLFSLVWRLIEPLVYRVVEVVVIVVLSLLPAQPLHALTQSDFSFGEEVKEVVVCENNQAAASLSILWRANQVKATDLLFEEYVEQGFCYFRQYATWKLDDWGGRSSQIEAEQGRLLFMTITGQTSSDTVYIAWPYIEKVNGSGSSLRAHD